MSVGVAVPEPVVSVLIVVVVLVLLVADRAMVRERLFIENLGVGRLGILRTAAVAVPIGIPGPSGRRRLTSLQLSSSRFPLKPRPT